LHISEGVLNSKELMVGAVAGFGLIIYTYRKLKFDDIPKVAFFSGLFFVLTFIHIPLGPSSIHLVGNGLLGYLIGFNAVLAIFIALLFQALIFGYGGITTLGINLLIISVPSVVVYLLLKKISVKNYFVFFGAGFLGVGLSSFLLALVLWLNGEGFKQVAWLVFATNIPLAFLEGFITMFLLKFLSKTELLRGDK